MRKIALLAVLAFGSAAHAATYTWNDENNVFPLNLSYPIAHEYAADHCEFYVDGFGAADFSSDGYTVQWLDAYVRVDASQPGQIVGVGMATGSDQYFGTLQSGVYHVGLTYSHTGPGISSGIPGATDGFSFFVDVRRSPTDVDRLWLRAAGGAEFTLAGVEQGASIDYETVGETGTAWVHAPSTIYDQKTACAQ